MYLYKAYKGAELLGEMEAGSLTEVRNKYPDAIVIKKSAIPEPLIRLKSECKEGVCPNKVTKKKKNKKSLDK